jgi:hypothetical protein
LGIPITEQQRLPSGLNLVTAAIGLWNTVYMEQATQALRDASNGIDDQLLHPVMHMPSTGRHRKRKSRTLSVPVEA